MLNMDDNDINNLDLNEDGNVDYVMVRDDQDGDTHALVIYTGVNSKNSRHCRNRHTKLVMHQLNYK